jgi:hypothetical protein
MIRYYNEMRDIFANTRLLDYMLEIKDENSSDIVNHLTYLSWSLSMMAGVTLQIDSINKSD